MRRRAFALQKCVTASSLPQLSAMAVFLTDKAQHSQSIEQFLKEIEDDFGSPGNSKFQDYIPKARKNLQAMEEVTS